MIDQNEIQGQPWGGTVAEAQSILPIAPNHPFYLIHDPKQWELVFVTKNKRKTAKWAPRFSKLWEQGGVNGVRGSSNGNVDTMGAKMSLQKKGIKILDPKEHDYIRRYRARRGFYYQERFYTIETVGNKVLETFDHEAYNSWRVDLVENGEIKPPHPHILKLAIETQRQRVDRLIPLQHLPQRNEQLKAEETTLKAMRAAAKKIKDEVIDGK